MIQEIVPESKKEQFAMKNQMKLTQAISEDLKKRIFEKIGFTDDKSKISFKPTDITIRERTNGLNHHLSEHSMGLQRGKYIAIEDDIGKLKTQYDIGKKKTVEDIKNEKGTSKPGSRSKLAGGDLSLNLRYCLASDVGKKRNDFLIYKAVFLQKIGNLKHNG